MDVTISSFVQVVPKLVTVIAKKDMPDGSEMDHAFQLIIHCVKLSYRQSLVSDGYQYRRSGCQINSFKLSEDCAKKENEILYEYASDRPCENTCKNYKRDDCKGIEVINTLVPAVNWQPRCDCKEGYARLPNGKCVSVYDPSCINLYIKGQSVATNVIHYFPFNFQYIVEKECGLNEVFTIRPICDAVPTCELPNGPEYVCLAMGYEGTCYCRSGYLRNKDNVCVAKSEC